LLFTKMAAQVPMLFYNLNDEYFICRR